MISPRKISCNIPPKIPINNPVLGPSRIDITIIITKTKSGLTPQGVDREKNVTCRTNPIIKKRTKIRLRFKEIPPKN